MRRLGQGIAAGFDPRSGAPTLPWLAFALLVAAIPPIEALTQYFATPYTVQDDARQFVFWMRRWAEQDLFAGDTIAEYFEAVSPIGFKVLYRFAFAFGLDPFTTNAVLPIVLGLALGYYAFRLSHLLLPAPAIGVLAVWLTVFFVWLLDTVASGTPRAFAVPLLLAFAVHLVRGSVLGVLFTVALTGLFYPQATLIACAALGLSLVRGSGGRLSISWSGADWKPVLAGLAAAAAVLAPFALASGEYGPTITVEAAKADPLFQPAGRAAYFVNGPLHFLACGERSGLLPDEWGCGEAFRQGLAIAPALAILELLFAFGLPFLLLRRAMRDGKDAPSTRIGIVVAILLGGVILWGASHLLAFAMHLPSRYGQYPLRALSMLCLALALAPTLHGMARRLRASVMTGIGALVAAGMIALPIALPYVPNPLYVHGEATALYRFLAERRPNGLVATLSTEADMLPSLARRPVLTGREYLIPYATRYYRSLTERTEALIQAQYAADLAPVQALIRHYRVTDLVLDADAFTRGYVDAAWWRAAFPTAATAIDLSRRPALQDQIERCQVFTDPRHIVLDAICLLSE